MKWIGQHIWDFISRFRNDVYLEDLTESAQDHVVGIDADGKLYKQDVSSGDITGVDISVGTGLDISQSNTTSGDYSSTISLDLTEVGVDGSNNQLLTDNGDGTVTSEANAIYTNDALQLSSSVSGKPTIQLVNSNTDADSPKIVFQKTATGADDDELGAIHFYGDDENAVVNSFAEIIATIKDATDTTEAGGVEMKTMTQGVLRPFISAVGQGSSTRVSVDLAYGLGSITTVAGKFKTLGEDVTFSSSTTTKPVVEIINTNTDGTGPELKLNNTKGGNDGADGDYAGQITFNTMNDDGGGSSQSTQEYGRIYVRVDDATSTEESGAMLFDVANHDGGLNTALSLVGGSEDGEVDATIGCGALSSTTIAGIAYATSGASILNDSYLVFSDSDNSHTTRVKASTTSTNRTILFPDATGTVQLQGPSTGQIINVSLMKDDNYVLYLNTRNYWYSTAGLTYTGNINVSAGNWSSWSDDRQARHCGYIASQACKVNKVRLVGLFSTSYSSGALDFEFAIQKWTPGNNTTATVTTTYMTHTDHNGSYTEGNIYNLEFDVSGNNTLAAGDAFTLFARCVDSNVSARLQLWYGNCWAEVELT